MRVAELAPRGGLSSWCPQRGPPVRAPRPARQSRRTRHRQSGVHRRDGHRAGDHAAGGGNVKRSAWSWAARAPTSSSPMRPGAVRAESPYSVFDTAQDCCARAGSSSSAPSTTGSSSSSRRPRRRSSLAIPTIPPRSRHNGQLPAARDGARLHSDWARKARVWPEEESGEPAYAQGAYIQPTVFERSLGDAPSPRRRSSARRRGDPISTPKKKRSGWQTRRRLGFPARSWTGDIAKAIGCGRRHEIASGVVSVNCNSSVHARRRSVGTRCPEWAARTACTPSSRTRRSRTCTST